MTACARCGCDLSNLRELLDCADRRLNSAAQSLRACDWPRALLNAEKSWFFRHSPNAARVAFAASAAMGDAGRAALWLARIET